MSTKWAPWAVWYNSTVSIWQWDKQVQFRIKCLSCGREIGDTSPVQICEAMNRSSTRKQGHNSCVGIYSGDSRNVAAIVGKIRAVQNCNNAAHPFINESKCLFRVYCSSTVIGNHGASDILKQKWRVAIRDSEVYNMMLAWQDNNQEHSICWPPGTHRNTQPLVHCCQLAPFTPQLESK